MKICILIISIIFQISCANNNVKTEDININTETENIKSETENTLLLANKFLKGSENFDSKKINDKQRLIISEEEKARLEKNKEIQYKFNEYIDIAAKFQACGCPVFHHYIDLCKWANEQLDGMKVNQVEANTVFLIIKVGTINQLMKLTKQQREICIRNIRRMYPTMKWPKPSRQ